LRFTRLEVALALVVLPCVAAAQSGSGSVAPAAGGGTGTTLSGPGIHALTNPVEDATRPLEFGVLVQGGFGVTEQRNSFGFLMAGVHAGKVLTGNVGPGMVRGNFEYAVEVFPIWQSYTPLMQRQNCAPAVPGSVTYECSTIFNVGGTFTGVSITPTVFRWNFAGTRRLAPWVQGAGGVLWTNHKYPAFGGPPYCSPGPCSDTNPGETLINNIASANTSVWNFTPQFGVGAHYFMRPNRSIDIGANAIHISSASLGDKNPGVNASVQFTVGYSWWK
jgi:hypothetical protein